MEEKSILKGKAFLTAIVLKYLENLEYSLGALNFYAEDIIKEIIGDPVVVFGKVHQTKEKLVKKLFEIVAKIGKKCTKEDLEKITNGLKYEGIVIEAWEELKDPDKAYCEYEKEIGKRGVRYEIRVYEDNNGYRYLVLLKEYAIKYSIEDGKPIFVGLSDEIYLVEL